MYDVTLGKKKPIREAYADRWVRERCQLGINKCDDRSSRSTYFFFAFDFLDFFAAFFFAGISESPPLGHALSLYRHICVANVNT
ncbi:MAG TPA: hypothetical protein VFH14_05145 [Gemmatimonadaceae bacterium]|jgi:hypothetical protein|nr:hypothetical protein [Gemmatimonadaceae bacterium]